MTKPINTYEVSFPRSIETNPVFTGLFGGKANCTRQSDLAEDQKSSEKRANLLNDLAIPLLVAELLPSSTFVFAGTQKAKLWTKNYGERVLCVESILSLRDLWYQPSLSIAKLIISPFPPFTSP